MDVAYFTQVAGLAALSVVVVQQILKLKFIPVSFANKYPVPTNILLSVVSAIIVTWKTSVQPVGFAAWTFLIATISIVAAITYNALLKNWQELRATEGPAE